MPPEDLEKRPPSPEFASAFRVAAGDSAALPFDRFMDLALYHPGIGYYRQDRKRVGHGPGSDFYTASTTGPLFGELIHAACQTLLGIKNLADYTFVEIGAEPGGGILAGTDNSFGQTKTIRLGEPLEISGRCVVFSNELFDAQPFRRFQLHNGTWQELGVALHDGQLREITLPPPIVPPAEPLPATAPEGYRIDLPLAAAALAQNIAAQPWTGLFVAFDYGKTWQELITATPAGTARAYHQHRQSNDLLAQPGRQDLTCHICWDWLVDALAQAGFAEPKVETQEAFLIRRAGEFMSATVSAEAHHLSQKKLGLLQLIHHLGQKFQVLWGLRQ